MLKRNVLYTKIVAVSYSWYAQEHPGRLKWQRIVCGFKVIIFAFPTME